MKRKIVYDAACDTNEEIRSTIQGTLVPLQISIGDKLYVDRGDVDIPEFLDAIDASETIPKTAAPSPQAFVDAAEDADEVFIVCMTPTVSSTYDNACVGAKMLEEEGRRAYVFNSKTGSGGQANLCLKIREWIDEGLSFDDIVEKGDAYANVMQTYFILRDLNTLIKSGRLPKFAGKVAGRLSIVPILHTVNGTIESKGFKRGFDRALKRVYEIIEEQKDLAEKTLFVMHTGAREKAEEVARDLMERAKFKAFQIIETGGLISVYAARGGIVLNF